MEIKDIMRVETLPKIVEQLQEMSVDIDNEVQLALSLDYTEENKQQVKKARANINKIKTELEERRKNIKQQILEPYMRFEELYNKLIKDKLVYADSTLKSRISEIEIKQIEEKKNNVVDYFNEYCESLHLQSVVSLDQLNIKIGLSDSEKKLLDQVKSKLESISNDLKLIELEEHNNLILLEYKNNGFDFANAKLTVINRLNELQKIQEEMNKKEQIEIQEQAIVDKVEQIIIPDVQETVDNVEKPVENFVVKFEVKGSKEQLKALKDFMLQNNLGFKSL